eukprot:CAMPEP_0173111734 /NCGR_PEP_ID=MMETSP1102-20130122/45417_1 /TAXON_ID=49646 /ORGANISM="Geminigera sp., Strain Caron Lab Isolate" /LENGTH=264 /DNA_ID=CAMNT_0014012307 /DNA_START=173 /DNA_END=964 /DNA_ORIENTATION=+
MRNTDGGSYLKIPMWWVGTLLMVLGELGNLVAYSLAKPSLISPLGAVSVVINVPVAWIVLGEKASFRNVCGCVMCVLGGYGIVGVVANGETERDTLSVADFQEMAFRPAFMVFLVISVFESLDLICSLRQTVMCYITVCSLLGGVTVLSIKAVTSFLILTMQGNNQLVYALPYALLPILFVTLLLQVQYLNKAIAEFGTSQVVPVYYVIFTSWAVLGSAILYGDLNETTTEHLFIFAGSFLATSVGVYLVACQEDDGVKNDGQL